MLLRTAKASKLAVGIPGGGDNQCSTNQFPNLRITLRSLLPILENDNIWIWLLFLRKPLQSCDEVLVPLRRGGDSFQFLDPLVQLYEKFDDPFLLLLVLEYFTGFVVEAWIQEQSCLVVKIVGAHHHLL